MVCTNGLHSEHIYKHTFVLADSKEEGGVGGGRGGVRGMEFLGTAIYVIIDVSAKLIGFDED